MSGQNVHPSRVLRKLLTWAKWSSITHRANTCNKSRSLHVTTCSSANFISDPENKGKTTRGVNFDTLGTWNTRLELPIHYDQSIKKGKIIPRVPVDEVGIASIVGRRSVNEDRYVIEELKPELLYFGVYDGHGGSFAADFVSTHMVDHLSFWLTQTRDLSTVLRQAFCDVNNLLARHLALYHIDSENFKTGTTATVCLFHNSTELVVGHVGDSICLLCREGEAIRLSEDHDPDNKEESRRIIKKGGRIIHNSQGVAHVNGRLAMTRSVGDLELKSFGVTAQPQVKSIEIKHGKDAFLVLSSDGLTFAISDREMVSIVSTCKTPQEACSRLLDQAQHFGSEDNCTVMVVPLGAWGKYEKASANTHYNFGRILSHSRIY